MSETKTFNTQLNKRLSTISENEEVFKNATPKYQEACHAKVTPPYTGLHIGIQPTFHPIMGYI